MVNPKKDAKASSNRVTIMLDMDLEFILRKIQAKKIVQNIGNMSFSHVINGELRKHFAKKGVI